MVATANCKYNRLLWLCSDNKNFWKLNIVFSRRISRRTFAQVNRRLATLRTCHDPLFCWREGFSCLMLYVSKEWVQSPDTRMEIQQGNKGPLPCDYVYCLMMPPRIQLIYMGMSRSVALCCPYPVPSTHWFMSTRYTFWKEDAITGKHRNNQQSQARNYDSSGISRFVPTNDVGFVYHCTPRFYCDALDDYELPKHPLLLHFYVVQWCIIGLGRMMKWEIFNRLRLSDSQKWSCSLFIFLNGTYFNRYWLSAGIRGERYGMFRLEVSMTGPQAYDWRHLDI